MKKLCDILGKELLFFDGGTGTVLQGMGLKPGELPETWNIKYPDRIVQLHYNYFAAGSNIVNTNTFGAFITKFPLELERLITAAIDNANAARDKILAENPNGNYYIAFDIGSCGKLLKPMGDLDFEDCVKLFKKTFKAAFDKKIDCVMIETMNDGYESKAAVLAAKETMEELGIAEGTLPIIVSNVYDKECRTLSGSCPETMVAMLEGLGVSAVGVNCSLGPLEMKPTVERLCRAASVPVLVKPNAGLPKVVDGKTVFDVKAPEFVEAMKELAALGPMILGGCCGTTPEYIKGIAENVVSIRPAAYSTTGSDGEAVVECPQSGCIETTVTGGCIGCVSSNTKVVYFGGPNRPVLIGERINPTGKKKFKEALRAGDIPYIIHQGMEQEEAGAQVLDVNVGLPEIDEKEMMLRVLEELQNVTTLPLQIDTTKPDVMEAALRRYNGKAMINSVNGKQEIMDTVFPLVKKYGGLVVALTLDEDGIPEDSARRVEIAKKIYKEAEKYGIKKSDIIIDPLAMAVSSDSRAGIATMETVRAIHEMGGLTSLGISNVSFGLPLREFVTASFFTLCMGAGLSAAIMNPLQGEMIKAWRCYNLLSGRDENCTDYIEWSTVEAERLANMVVSTGSTTGGNAGGVAGVSPAGGGSEQRSASEGEASPTSSLSNAIIHGLKTDAAAATRELLKSTESLTIINEHLIPGLDYVGKRFEKKTMYLPQLLMAAEAAKAAFGEIREFMEKSGKKGAPKGKIIIATVKGDIHDIGKNIVKVLLENYDFEVIDLGKDVPPEVVVEACKKDHVMLVGLSALMTTTVAAMEETIKLLRKECPWAKTCVGGAVMTQEYADQIGADFYGKDAMDTVRFALEMFK
ncbi:homocysteine S-methyltransferase family protein [Treponema bryantii]|uniref:homocysteine S-methyltransferase family protein n=1 Tax=Treponema bryantii TaxID=163 RepID=UPI0003B396DC|nr:homocysteine S-methyltransferase family protein [Treponema bryantii]